MLQVIRNSLFALFSLSFICLPIAAEDIWTAAAEGDTKTLRKLIKEGQDVNAADPGFGFSALTFAVLQNQPKAVRILARNGADVSTGQLDGNTPLHAAVFVGHDKVVKELLRAGADPTQANNQGQLPASTAQTDWQTTQYLASMLQLTLDEDEVNAGREKALELINKAIDKLARSDIWLAVITGNERAVKRLARKVDDLNAKEEASRTTLLILAAINGYANIVETLIDAGADVDVRGDDGATALLVAAFFGRADAVEVLLKHGADTSISNNEGITPLAAAQADMSVVDYIAGMLNLELDYDEVIAGKRTAATLLSDT